MDSPPDGGTVVESITIRVDPGVHKAIKSIGERFGWSTSDVASTILWVGLAQINRDLLPADVKDRMVSDMFGILRNFFMLSSEDPMKAADNFRKTMVLLSKSQS